jgi:hypothetical protein
VNPISKATSAIFHPVRTATTVAGQSLALAAAGAKTTMRIIDRAAGQSRADSPRNLAADDTPPPASATSTGDAPVSNHAADQPPAKRPTARKPRPKKTAAKKAPSARAATVAPALSKPAPEADELRTPSGIPAADEGYNPDTAETDLHQPGTEPLMDPATVKAIRSEAEVMQRAADPDKG